MKKAVFSCLMVILPFVLLNACLFSGCEPAEGLDGLTINPSSATLTPSTSNTVIFTVAQVITNELAYPIEWSVSDGSLGSITASTANSAVYKSTGKNGNNTIKAKDQYGNEGVATVTQTSDSYTLTLTASPSSLNSTSTVCTVTVSGGVAPYSWSVSDSSAGSISGSGSSVMYTASRAGSNAITVTDEYGMSASIAITRTDSSSSGGTTTPTPGG